MRRHARCDRDSFELTRVENRCGRLGDVTTRMPTLEQSQPADLQEASSRRSATDGLFAFERASTEKNEGRLEPDRVSIEARVLARCRAMCAALDVRGHRTCAGTIASTVCGTARQRSRSGPGVAFVAGSHPGITTLDPSASHGTTQATNSRARAVAFRVAAMRIASWTASSLEPPWSTACS